MYNTQVPITDKIMTYIFRMVRNKNIDQENDHSTCLLVYVLKLIKYIKYKNVYLPRRKAYRIGTK